MCTITLMIVGILLSSLSTYLYKNRYLWLWLIMQFQKLKSILHRKPVLRLYLNLNTKPPILEIEYLIQIKLSDNIFFPIGKRSFEFHVSHSYLVHISKNYIRVQMKRQRGLATRSGINKQGWETSDFPVACDKCYGENPYMRMLKQNYGQECRICFRPFTVFKWKGNKGVYKRTCVCSSCSKDKNICQVCTLDLEFGLPMDVRDRRCGKNGADLINENFISTDNEKVKPPPPSLPPPKMTKAAQKEYVFVPEANDDSEEEVQLRVAIQGQLLRKAKNLQQNPENHQKQADQTEKIQEKQEIQELRAPSQPISQRNVIDVQDE